MEVGQAEDWLAEDMSGCWSTHRLDEHLEVGPGAGFWAGGLEQEFPRSQEPRGGRGLCPSLRGSRKSGERVQCSILTAYSRGPERQGGGPSGELLTGNSAPRTPQWAQRKLQRGERWALCPWEVFQLLRFV